MHINARWLGVLGFASVVGACYTHRPLTSSVPAPATRIVAKLTDQGVVEMERAIGVGAVEVEGEVAAADTAVWELQVTRVDYRRGGSVLWNGERVTFPRYALTNATQRTLNKGKTWLTAGLLTAGAVLAARLFGAFGPGGDSGGEPPPPN